MSGPASDAGTIRREALVRKPESGSTQRTLSRARPETSRFLLDFDLHGSRQVVELAFIGYHRESRHAGCDPESEVSCQRIAVEMGAYLVQVSS
jgi:hypothetical protein